MRRAHRARSPTACGRSRILTASSRSVPLYAAGGDAPGRANRVTSTVLHGSGLRGCGRSVPGCVVAAHATWLLHLCACSMQRASSDRRERLNFTRNRRRRCLSPSARWRSGWESARRNIRRIDGMFTSEVHAVRCASARVHACVCARGFLPVPDFFQVSVSVRHVFAATTPLFGRMARLLTPLCAPPPSLLLKPAQEQTMRT